MFEVVVSLFEYLTLFHLGLGNNSVLTYLNYPVFDHLFLHVRYVFRTFNFYLMTKLAHHLQVPLTVDRV